MQIIFAGVFDRFPTLDLVCAEVDCGWVPYFKEQIDNNYRRLAPISDFTIASQPSDYVEQHVHFCYITDSVGVATGATRSASSGSCGPATTPTSAPTGRTSWKTIQASMATVPRAERELILAGNAMRLYRL